MTTAPTEALAPPRPAPDEITSFFWEGVEQHRLLILRCDDCGHYIHLPREVCRFCLSTNLSPSEMSGEGTVETFTVPYQPFHPYFRQHIGYVLAVVRLAEDPDLRLVTNIVDCSDDDVRCDMPVHVVFREVAPGFTLPYFAPGQGPNAGEQR